MRSSANLYFDAERYDDAISWYQEALKLAPNGRQRQHRPRRAATTRTSADKALRAVRHSLKLDPKHAEDAAERAAS